MSRYIDAEWLMKYFKRGKDYKGEYVLDDLKYDAPSKEIIRCGECKHNYNTAINHGKMQPKCDYTDYKLTENDFCSRGEREDE